MNNRKLTLLSPEIGNILVDSLSPIIGRAGLYFFVFPLAWSDSK